MRFLSVFLVVFVANLSYAWDKPTGVSPQVISLPAGAGTVQGLGESFDVNAGSGTASYGIALKASGPLAPQLRLTYNGGRGNSAVGIGWDLPLTCIARQTDQGLPDYDSDDVFVLRGLGVNEELVKVEETEQQTTYRLDTEGAFVRVVRLHAGHRRDLDTWEVHGRDGTVYSFGTTPSARRPTANSGATCGFTTMATIPGG
jgi:hypothetical protein